MEKTDTKCKRCDHKWERRVRNPLQCPRCKSNLWDKDKKNIWNGDSTSDR